MNRNGIKTKIIIILSLLVLIASSSIFLRRKDINEVPIENQVDFSINSDYGLSEEELPAFNLNDVQDDNTTNNKEENSSDDISDFNLEINKNTKDDVKGEENLSQNLDNIADKNENEAYIDDDGNIVLPSVSLIK